MSAEPPDHIPNADVAFLSLWRQSNVETVKEHKRERVGDRVQRLHACDQIGRSLSLLYLALEALFIVLDSPSKNTPTLVR